MTRKSKREIEREVSNLSNRGAAGRDEIVIACEHDDGTITDLDGEPLPDGWRENAGLVLHLSCDVARTWP